MDPSTIRATPEDVLCGKESSSYNHAGNKHFRELVMASLPTYRKAHSRLQKTAVVKDAFASILNRGGRFLKKDPTTGNWSELSSEEAKDKVARAIRDAAQFRDTKKHQRASRKQQIQLQQQQEQQQQYKQPPTNHQHYWPRDATSGRDEAQLTRNNMASANAAFGARGFPSGNAPAHAVANESVPHGTSISRMRQYDSESLKGYVNANGPMDADATTPTRSAYGAQPFLPTSRTSRTSRTFQSPASEHPFLRTRRERRADNKDRDLDDFLLRMNSTLSASTSSRRGEDDSRKSTSRPVQDCNSHLNRRGDTGYRHATSDPINSGNSDFHPPYMRPGNEAASLDSLKNNTKGSSSTNDNPSLLNAMMRGHESPWELVEGRGNLKGDSRTSSWQQDSLVASSYSTSEGDAGDVNLQNTEANRLYQDLASLEDELQVLNFHHGAPPTSTNGANSAASSSKANSPQHHQLPCFRPVQQTIDVAPKTRGVVASVTPPVEANSERIVSIPEESSLSDLPIVVQTNTHKSLESQHGCHYTRGQSKGYSDDDFLCRIESVLGSSMSLITNEQELMNASLGDISVW